MLLTPGKIQKSNCSVIADYYFDKTTRSFYTFGWFHSCEIIMVNLLIASIDTHDIEVPSITYSLWIISRLLILGISSNTEQLDTNEKCTKDNHQVYHISPSCETWGVIHFIKFHHSTTCSCTLQSKITRLNHVIVSIFDLTRMTKTEVHHSTKTIDHYNTNNIWCIQMICCTFKHYKQQMTTFC